MAESMTAVEIEDVLSSIRRLVSEDLRPTHKLVSAALQSSAGKLILTPALRIVSDVRTALPEYGEPLAIAGDLQSVLLDIEAKDDTQSVEATPVFGSIRLQDHGDSPERTSSPDGEMAASDGNFLKTAMSRINGLSSAGGNAGQSDTIEAVVAVVGAAVGPDEWEPDGGEPAPQSKAWADTVWTSELAESHSDAAGSADDGGAAGAEALQGLVTDIAADDLQADKVFEDDRHHDDDRGFAGSDSIVFQAAAMPQDDAHADSIDHDASRDHAASIDYDHASSDDLDDISGHINEDVLREIVRDMIREELQGPLGERITRNVRKLVRAEINRALASRDFDDIANRG